MNDNQAPLIKSDIKNGGGGGSGAGQGCRAAVETLRWKPGWRSPSCWVHRCLGAPAAPEATAAAAHAERT